MNISPSTLLEYRLFESRSPTVSVKFPNFKKQRNTMQSFKKSVLNPSATLALGFTLFATSANQLHATNPPGGGSIHCPSGGCSSSGKAGQSSLSTKSVYWYANVGLTNHFKGNSFVGYFKAGAVAGTISNQGIRSYRSMLSTLYGNNNLGRTQVQLEIDVDKIEDSFYDPSTIMLHNDGEFVRIDDQGFINQVLTDDAFTHIDKLPDGFRIRVWSLSQISLSKLFLDIDWGNVDCGRSAKVASIGRVIEVVFLARRGSSQEVARFGLEGCAQV